MHNNDPMVVLTPAQAKAVVMLAEATVEPPECGGYLVSAVLSLCHQLQVINAGGKALGRTPMTCKDCGTPMQEFRSAWFYCPVCDPDPLTGEHSLVVPEASSLL